MLASDTEYTRGSSPSSSSEVYKFNKLMKHYLLSLMKLKHTLRSKILSLTFDLTDPSSERRIFLPSPKSSSSYSSS